ncbi:MAG: ACT domain-containing protein [Syntrophobacteraceae bacterium]|nr:ACT domain-containing protein [Syntrophobacteraceae bacterium]
MEKLEQISVFLENQPGRLFDVTRILVEANINIRALSLADTTDFGILRLIVSDCEKARKELKENGFTVGTTDVVAVEVQDQPGGLHDILKLLKNANVNIEYMYAFVQTSGKDAIIIFRFDNIGAALQQLKESGVRVIDGESLYKM